jgi:hypothetical protein
MKWVVLSLALLGGCGRTDAVTKYESWADDACACKDAACVTKAEAELKKLSEKYTGVKMQKADTEAIFAAAERGGKCLVEARQHP